MCQDCEDKIHHIYSSILTQFDLNNIDSGIAFCALERLYITSIIDLLHEEEIDQYLWGIKEFCHRVKKARNHRRFQNEEYDFS